MTAARFVHDMLDKRLGTTTRSTPPHEHACLPPLPAQEPANECAEHEAGLGCKRDIDCHAEDDAKRQTEYSSEPNGGSHAHVRECTFSVTSAGDSGPVSR